MTVYSVWSRWDGQGEELTFHGLYSTPEKCLNKMEEVWRSEFRSDMPKSTNPGCSDSFRSRMYDSVCYCEEQVN